MNSPGPEVPARCFAGQRQGALVAPDQGELPRDQGELPRDQGESADWAPAGVLALIGGSGGTLGMLASWVDLCR